MRQRRRVAHGLVTALAVTLGLTAPGAHAQQFAGEVTNYVDPSQQTLLSFGDRSHWLQPWRAYLDTVPAARLRKAVGISFNVADSQADATARLLAANGFRRARVDWAWNSIRYDDPNQLTNVSSLRTRLLALKKYGIRPLIVIHSNDGEPCPSKSLTLRTIEPALAGDTRVHLDAATAAAVVPRKTGFAGLQTSGKAADPMITSVDADGWATLSRTLRRELPAGAYSGSKLLYEPFYRPLQADGSPEPRFEATLAGWLNYAKVITREAKTILGSQNFDVEVWNELHFGAEFLDVDEYYGPDIDTGHGNTTGTILERTVAWIRNPANGVSKIGIADGFANQHYIQAGSTSPPGLTAIAKHPYLYDGVRWFPPPDVNEIRPLDAQGDPDGVFDPDSGTWSEFFTPTYFDFHPERYLWATEKTSFIELDQMVRDLSPLTTYVDGVAHGRDTHPPGSAPPEVWITEMNVNTANAAAQFGVTPGDRLHMQAKATLRTVLAFVGKGVSAVHLFAVTSGNYALVDAGFFTSLKQTGVYPGDRAGGEVLNAVWRVTQALAGADQTAPRPLQLLRIGDYAGNKQFEGDGTADHPPLYNRDVLAFLPFQVNARRFVVAVYVMTVNIAKKYNAAAPNTDPTRFDMPPETYRLTIGNTGGPGTTVSATDPLTGKGVPVTVVANDPGQLVVELPVTDSPRLLTIREPG